MQRPNGTPVEIYQDKLRTFNLDDPLPSTAQQADSLILWIGDHQPSQAQELEILAQQVSAWIGAPITPNGQDEALTWLLQQQEIQTLVKEHDAINGPIRLGLTFEGWHRYKALKYAVVESRSAFMAMKFGDEELNRIVNGYFKPAVERTGFELRDMTEGQPAGIIDDQIRVALRTSRFVVADLTHGNKGAYWEAGFAEGLGRPVIYTCRKKEWDAGKAHFDTNHLNTVIWDPDNPGKLPRLTLMIRATLPAEAKMTDR
jgi:hypothetical protein